MQSNAKSENGFHFREIRLQCGFQLRNPNPISWISLIYLSIGKSERGFAKIILLNSGLLFVDFAYA